MKQIIAHRGASNLARENTLEAFEKAIGLGADGIELDVRKTADGVLAVFHDADIGGKKIADISFAELNRVSSAHNFLVPTLEQVLQLAAGKTHVFIEIKARGYEKQTAETALKFLRPDEFEVISFIFPVLLKIKNLYPQIKLGLILGPLLKRINQNLFFLFCRRDIMRTVDSFCLNYKLFGLSWQGLIPKKYPINVWTADSERLLKKFLNDPRVTSITSNKPELVLKLRNKYGAKS